MLHRELGFGPKFMDTELRLLYPTLPWLALRSQLLREALAEEMRILYVALTRAQEKLILVAAVNDLAKEVQKWAAISRSGERLLPLITAPGPNAAWTGSGRRCCACSGRCFKGAAKGSAIRACQEEEEPSSWSVRLHARDVAGSGAVPDQERERGEDGRKRLPAWHLSLCAPHGQEAARGLTGAILTERQRAAWPRCPLRS